MKRRPISKNLQRKTSRKPLPRPTPSEAAFERLLDSFDSGKGSEQAPSEFVERLFAEGSKYLERDSFSGIGERETFPTKIMGVSFEGRQDVVAGLIPGASLELRRQPDNEFDPNAIACFFGAFHVGFLRKQIAKHLAPLIDAGILYRAQVEHVTGGRDGKNFGVNIRVSRDTVTVAPAMSLQLRAGHDRAALMKALIGDAQPHAAQRDLLARMDAGKNTLAVLGTGRGKSFCFQYPAAYGALERGRKTLAIYPLRALANDQFEALVRRLDGFGVRIYRANGSIGADERASLMQALRSAEWDVIMATPEFLAFHREAFAGQNTPDLIVIDEAHHLFESRHRAAYQKLPQTIASFGKPQVLALTATARDEAFGHVIESLQIDAWVIDPTVRENLRVVDARETTNKVAYLQRLFTEGGKGIVYCNSRNEATKVAQKLHKDFPNDALFYHGGMPTPERLAVENYFRSGALRIVVATSAFGEGIDLPDVRHVVLYHLNFDFTEFNQQAGRAGRDGAPADIHLLFGEKDRRINEFIIDQEAPKIGVLRQLYKAMRELAPGGRLRMDHTEISRTLELDNVTERTVGAALRIFEDAELMESGIDDDGRFIEFRKVVGKIDLRQNERFAEGEAERENFARFCNLALASSAEALERIINRPIYPQRIQLIR